MKPAPFRYISARSLDEALAAKAEHGDEARFLAGGQSLVPAMNFRLAQPAVLIDINALAELGGVRRDADAIRIGALTRYYQLQADQHVAAHQKLLGEALPHIAHPQIRNRGTLGGNLAHADPASEMPALVLTLGGRLRAQSATGERWIAADDFFVGALTTALQPDELLAEIELPDLPAGTGTCFMEVARRRGDFALMGVVATMTLDANGHCTQARLGYCNAGDGPLLANEAAASLIGGSVTEADINAAAVLAQKSIDPAGNQHAAVGYQRHLAGVLTRRTLKKALYRARDAAGAAA
jgi:carbon-monoxide dehydrogenase medium subunit